MDHPRYRTGDLIGVGGMGAVYKAEHLLMQRPVAVKVLNHELIDNPATVDRFRREVRAAARLTHPNIVAAFDAEQAGDVHFLAMEYVEGVSLARRCAEYGPLPVAEACSYARQAALGLQHAHECGMVHRDIKPQNLMLTAGGQVKILDFGLARFVMESVPVGAMLPIQGDSAPTSGIDGKAKPLTQIGVVMGTPDYIAPEQAQDSHQADIRADIYSLGCTLYDMLAGHAPFPDGNAVQKIKAHLHKTPPPLKTLRRDVPLELVRVIERMMAKDPAQRYQTPAEAAAALAPFASSARPRRKKWPLLVAALGFVAALVLGAIIYVQTDRGTIVIETNDDKIAVMIEKAGGVKIIDQANKREYLLRPGAQDVPSGNYLVEVTEPLGGLDFETKKFELKRGKEVRLTARFEAIAKGVKLATALTAPDRKRANDRLESLKEIAGLNEIMYREGKVVFDQVLAAKRDVAKAELDQCESDAERVKIYEKIVALAQEIVKFREAQYQAAQIPKVVALKAKADLLGALDDLDRAKAWPTTRDTVLPKQASGDQGPFFGGKPASFWLEQLKDANPNFRVEAVKALGMIAQKDKELIPVLVAALKDQDADPGFRFEAVKALGVIARKDKELIPVLVAALNDQDTDPGVRFEAVRVLGVIARKDKELIPVLAAALKDKNFEVGDKAAEVLGALGSQTVPALMDVLRSKASPSAMFNAIVALGRIGPEAKAAVPLLSHALKMDKWVGPGGGTTWRSAIITLGEVGPEAKPAIPAMIDLLGYYLEKLDVKREPGLFDVLGKALTQIDPQLKDILPSDVNPFQNAEAQRALWHKAYNALKKRYPKQTGADGQAGTPGADLKQELARFEGTWTLVKQQVRWETTFPGTKYIFSGTTMTIVEGNGLDAMHKAAEAEFNRYDRNSDGFLDNDELPPQLKSELGKWDTNRDNLISLDEYKLYYAARMQNRRAKEHIIAVLNFKIDPSKTPKTIDLYRPAKGDMEASTGLGIYELTGDTLKICLGATPDVKRPTSFADTEKNLSIVFLKKGEPAQAAGGVSPKPDQGPLFGGKKGGKGVGDRNRVFDILANGRAYFLISDVSPRLGSALWQYLKDKGITNGQVTREIFEAFNDDGSQLSVGEEHIKSEQAIKALGGAVVRNLDAPGRPIIHVDFFGTHVRDAGLKALAGLKSLQTLNLEGTEVTDAGLKELAG
ncbi:MAG TPA: sister chromatid cohesion protein PDS5, partial [Gemmataceae bacterium]|nr:sister chromatid cohesion protein PDS5 [Gemmataceae bacterium]